MRSMEIDELHDRFLCALFQESVAAVVVEYFDDTIGAVLLQR